MTDIHTAIANYETAAQAIRQAVLLGTPVTDDLIASADAARAEIAELAQDYNESIVTCHRCGGAGGFKHWPGFTCFECGGTKLSNPYPVRVRHYVKGATVKRRAEQDHAEEQARQTIERERLAAATEWAKQNDLAEVFAFAQRLTANKEAFYADRANEHNPWIGSWPRKVIVSDRYAITTLRDLASNLIRWGQLTDKQAAFATRLYEGLSAEALEHF